MNIDKNKTRGIIDLCHQHMVKELSLFGSFLTDDANAESDIDLLVEFKEIDVLDYFDNFMDFKEKLEILLERKRARGEAIHRFDVVWVSGFMEWGYCRPLRSLHKGHI